MVDIARVAIVGAGPIAREHARAFASLEGVTIVGVLSRTPEHTARLARFLRVPAYGSIRALYEESGADIVVVAVSAEAIKTISVECSLYPWVQLLEKPPGLDVEEARKIREAAQVHRRRVYVALSRRFFSSTQAVLSALQNSSERRIIHVQDQESTDDLARYARRYGEATCRHWRYAISIHLVDYFRVFGRGRVTQVVPITSWDPDSPDAQVLEGRIEYDSGDVGIYQCIWNAPGPWSVSVTTSQIRWDMHPLERAAYQKRTERVFHRLKISQDDRIYKPGFRLQAEHLVRAVQGGPSQSPTLDEAFETMGIIQAIWGAASS